MLVIFLRNYDEHLAASHFVWIIKDGDGFGYIYGSKKAQKLGFELFAVF